MIIEFMLHGGLDSTVKDSYDRAIRVQVPKRFGDNYQAFADEVLSDKAIADQIACVFPASDARPADIPGDDVSASQIRSSVRARTQELPGLPFLSYVNMNRNPNFMTFRLAKHLVALLEDEMPMSKRPETLRREQELRDLEALKADLSKYEGATLPSSIQHTLDSLDFQIDACMRPQPVPEKALSPLDRQLETQYLRAAIEFGSKDGDLKFLDRSVDIFFGRQSPLTDKDGRPTQILKDKLDEHLFSHEGFSGLTANSFDMRDFALTSMLNPEMTSHGVRLVVTQVEEGRLLKALHKVMRDLSEGDVPTNAIRVIGDGNAVINHALLAGRMLDTVRLRRQVPMILNQGMEHQDPYKRYERTSEHLLMEARAYVAKHEKKFDAEYQEWRAKVEPLSEKTRNLSSNLNR